MDIRDKTTSIILSETLGKLPWISKIPLQGNGTAAISKIYNVTFDENIRRKKFPRHFQSREN